MREGGRAGVQAGRSPIAASRLRLKRSVEVFVASDETVLLMRLGTGDDLEIADASATERLVIGALSSRWYSEEELLREVRERGLAGTEVGSCLAALEEHCLLEQAEGEPLLTDREAERFDRQLIYWADLAKAPDSASLLQSRIGNANVVILGCGGLGSWAATALVCAGVGSLVLIDDDRVEQSNLNRQLLFGDADVGHLKVAAAAAALRRHQPDLNLRLVADRVRGPDDLEHVLCGADLLVETADWPPFRLPRWVNQACLAAKVPYITAAQFLPRVRIGPTVVPGRSACWECLERQTRARHPRYDEIAGRPPRPSTSATLAPASGLVGSLVAMEALHLLTGSVQPATLAGAFVIDLRTLAVTWEAVEQDPGCSVCARFRE